MDQRLVPILNRHTFTVIVVILLGEEGTGEYQYQVSLQRGKLCICQLVPVDSAIRAVAGDIGDFHIHLIGIAFYGRQGNIHLSGADDGAAGPLVQRLDVYKRQGQLHNTGVYKTHDHNGGGGGTLNYGRHEGPKQNPPNVG